MYSGIDLKAGFLNIGVTERTKPLLGIITQDGLFRFTRMAFGLSQAPMYFQHVMEDLLWRSPKTDLSTQAFFYDLTAHGDNIQEVWEDTLETFRLLAEEGIMINVKKCKLLVSRLELLGMVVFDSAYQLGPKTLKGWLMVEIPKTLQEV